MVDCWTCVCFHGKGPCGKACRRLLPGGKGSKRSVPSACLRRRGIVLGVSCALVVGTGTRAPGNRSGVATDRVWDAGVTEVSGLPTAGSACVLERAQGLCVPGYAQALPYKSECEVLEDRLYRRMRKLRKRVGAANGDMEQPLWHYPKPKYMHQSTYERLGELAEEARMEWLEVRDEKLLRLVSRYASVGEHITWGKG